MNSATPIVEEDEDLAYLNELFYMRKLVEIRLSHLSFMDFTWLPKEPFIHGFHTVRICAKIDEAIERFRKGQSTYLLISVHPRSGKTDLVSRYLGPHFLGEFPDKEVLQVSYQASLASSFSAFGRNVVRSEKYQELYPNVALSDETNRKDDWVLVERGAPTGGRLYATGLQSGLTGNGYSLGILDDYCAGRAEAESKVFRENSWKAFTDDFMTRRAPVHIVIVLATWWHIDDITGRIKKEMEKNPDFPKFDILSFPAKADDYRGEGKYPGEYLFEERFGKEWYRSMYATLGPYSAASLLDCNPQIRTGGRLSIEGISVETEMPSATDIQWYRVWDLAHTSKQRGGDDPDWTSGTKLSFQLRDGDPVPHLYVADVKRTREGAAARDPFIKLTASADGPNVEQGIENTIDSKDAFEYISQAIPDISWTELEIRGEKGARATPLEPIFAAPGHVHILRAEWNDAWIDEVMRFDGLGKDHDDQIDNLSAGYDWQIGQRNTFAAAWA